MQLDKLDNEELFFVALDAVNGGRYGEAVVILKELLEREPDNTNARYLLAAQYGQLGMHARAESGLRALLSSAPELNIARIQLAQLLLMRDAKHEVKEELSPMKFGNDALAAYARGFIALADDLEASALHELDSGLLLPQPVAALAADIRILCDRLRQSKNLEAERSASDQSNASPSTPMFMTEYNRH